MTLEDLSGVVINQLYSGLTGGSAELPLPDNMIINWVQPGIPFHESAFDWAIAGPYAGPTELTLDVFKELVLALERGEEGKSREDAIREAKVMYQANLLGGWEQWSRLVDFIPIHKANPEQAEVKTNSKQGKYKHVSLVYAQAGQTLSQVYKDTLERCEVANEELTKKQKDILERMKALLQEEVEVEDFLGNKKTEIRESRLMIAYKAKRTEYENAVIDYATRLSRSQGGTAQDLIEWSRSGGIYKQRAIIARRDWIANGYKNEVENAQATISHILGGNMKVWKDNLLQNVLEIEENVEGPFGYSFFPASIIPGSFARNKSWTKFEERNLQQKISSSSSSKDYGGSGGINLGLFRFGGSAGRKKSKVNFSFEKEEFGISFEYTQVEIVRPAFNPNFFLSRSWRPKDSFIRDYQELHSNGQSSPKGAMIGYPTKALFVRNLVIESSELAREMESYTSEIKGGASFGWGPFSIGGNYAQSDKESESNLEINGSKISIKGIQLVAFLSALFPYSANPSPDIKSWV